MDSIELSDKRQFLLPYLGPINRILSLKIFVPFSRVTYSAYLVHYPIVFHHFVGQKDGLYFSIHNIVSDPIDYRLIK